MVGSLAIDELQRILWPNRGIPFDERIRVGQQGNAFPGAQAEVVAALGADTSVALQFPGVDQLAAFGALDPQILGDRLVGTVVVPGEGAKLALALEEISHDRLASYPCA